METSFVEIYRPNDQQEVMLIKMALEGTDIGYYITSENFNSIMPLPGLSDMRLMVDGGQVQECIAILADLGMIGVERLHPAQG